MLTALLLAAAAETVDLAPICTDRPAKANAVCTVPIGRFQVEAGLAGWSLTKDSGTRTSLLTLGAPTLKYGLSHRSALQVRVTPFARRTVKRAVTAPCFGLR